MKLYRVSKFLPGLVGAAALLALAACATPPQDPDELAAYNEANDPAEPTNRRIFKSNMAIDKHAIKPVAQGYRDNVPSDARSSIRNFFDNLSTPVILINDILQGEGGRAMETLMRFAVNTTAGFFGLFDVAAEYGLEGHKEDFGQTLAVWGFGEGPYMMLPFFGPSNVRDTVGKVADIFMNPLTYVVGGSELQFVAAGTTIVDGVDQRSRKIEALDDIEKNSLDFYAALRSLYRQNRQSEILNGDVPDIPAPEVLEEVSDIPAKSKTALAPKPAAKAKSVKPAAKAKSAKKSRKKRAKSRARSNVRPVGKPGA